MTRIKTYHLTAYCPVETCFFRYRVEGCVVAAEAIEIGQNAAAVHMRHAHPDRPPASFDVHDEMAPVAMGDEPVN